MNAESLIRTLRAYDASIDAAAVRTALSEPKSADLVRWAAVHLTPDTLLTVDELNQSVLLSFLFLPPRTTLTIIYQICCPRGFGSGRETGHVVGPHRRSHPQ
jgi:hypothetical protein